MAVLFRSRAEADLRRIVAYFQTVAPGSVERVLDDIYRGIDLLIDFPLIGMPVPGTPFRRLVTRRYRFKIAYLAGEGQITIVGLYRFEDRAS